MIKRLIVNADDFGLSEGNTIGILSAHKKGILTSTTCMMNMPYAFFALQQAKRYPELGVGVHLTMTVGKPLLAGQKSYTDEKGNFKRKSAYPDGKPVVDKNELYDEWKAQIEKYISIMGHKPTHLDSHHHVHMLPWLNDVAVRLALEYDVPLRQRDRITDTYEYIRVDERFYDEGVSIDTLKKIINENDDIIELMNHVGFLDQELYELSSYNLPRMKELQIITSQEIKQFIEDNHIELIHFGHIKKMK